MTLSCGGPPTFCSPPGPPSPISARSACGDTQLCRAPNPISAPNPSFPPTSLSPSSPPFPDPLPFPSPRSPTPLHPASLPQGPHNPPTPFPPPAVPPPSPLQCSRCPGWELWAAPRGEEGERRVPEPPGHAGAQRGATPRPSPWSESTQGSLQRRSPRSAGRKAGRRRKYERLLAQAGLLRRGEATAQEEEETDRPLHDWRAHELRAPDAHRLRRHGCGRRAAHDGRCPGDEVQGRTGAAVEQLPGVVAYSWLFQPRLELPDPHTRGKANLERLIPVVTYADRGSRPSRWLWVIPHRSLLPRGTGR